MTAASSLFVPALLLLISTTGRAGEFASLQEEIATARKALVNMVLYLDKRSPEHQKQVKETADAVSAHFARLKAPEGKAAEFKELKETWEAFRKTREKELVPAILAGNREKYEKLGAGIQKERLDRMYALIAKLEK